MKSGENKMTKKITNAILTILLTAFIFILTFIFSEKSALVKHYKDMQMALEERKKNSLK